MERCQLHCIRVLRPHFKQDLLKRVELATVCVHVILVHLGDEDRGTDVTSAQKTRKQVDVDRDAGVLPHQP